LPFNKASYEKYSKQKFIKSDFNTNSFSTSLYFSVVSEKHFKLKTNYPILKFYSAGMHIYYPISPAHKKTYATQKLTTELIKPAKGASNPLKNHPGISSRK
jgi:archaellin